jgi:hypothetical protein
MGGGKGMIFNVIFLPARVGRRSIFEKVRAGK